MMRHTFLAKRRKGNPVSFHVITPYLPSLLGLLLLVSLFPGEGTALDLIRRVAAAVLGILRYVAWLPLILAPLLRREQRLATAGWVAVASGLITLAGGAGGQIGVIVAGLATTPAGPLVGALVLSAAAVAIPVRLLPFPLPARLLPGLTPAAVAPPPVASPTATPAKRQPRLVDPAQPPLILPRPPGASPVVARWTLPPLPPPPPAQAGRVNADHPPRLASTLTDTLNAFSVPGKVESWEVGPTITRYHFRLEQPADGRRVKVSRILGLRDDLALALAASPVRIQAPLPGTNLVGIEAPNQSRQVTPLSVVLASPTWAKAAGQGLTVALGQKTNGQPVVIRLDKAPHLLIAGATGSGKSVCLNTLLASLLVQHTPDTLRLLLTDPKQVELTPYNGLPHLLAPVVTDLSAIPEALNQAALAMEQRYKQLGASGVRNIEDYNAKCAAEARLPYIVLVLDEFGDMMAAGYKDEVEQRIARLASKARAAGIHLVLATQRPSVDVVTGLIKANFPARIAFAVTSQVDSRVILDQPGAETLLGRGDMLWLAPDKPHIERLQGAFVSDEEVEQLVAFWQAQSDPAASPGVSLESRPAVTDDDEDADLRERAIAIAQEQGYLSTSLLQRRLRIGYNRAARLVESLEADGRLAREGRRWAPVESGD